MEVGQSPEESQEEILEKKHERLLTETREKVKNGLRFDEGLPKFSSDIKERMTVAIAETMVETAEVLNLPLPEIRLDYQWGDRETEKKRRKIRARMDYLLKKDGGKTGVIFFTPRYLKETAQDMKYPIPVKERHEDELRLIVAHKMYHFRADEKFPHVAAREVQKYYVKGEIQLSKWFSSRVEQAAELFSLKYLKNRKAEGWRQIVGKSLALNEKKLTIQLLKMQQRIEKIKQRVKMRKKKAEKESLRRRRLVVK